MFAGSLQTTQNNLHSLFSTEPKIVKVPKKKHFSLKNFKRIFSWEFTEDYEPPPIDNNKKVLILDMDETLIHSSSFPPHPKISYFVLNNKKDEPNFYVYKRPGLDDFMKFVQSNFDVFIFTYGEKEYADPILDKIAPQIDKTHRLYRDLCEKSSGSVKKDLSIFRTSEKNIILVDDSYSALNFNPDNTINIHRWNGVPNDTALIKWLPDILKQCLKSDDVRKVISQIKKED